MFFTPGFCLKNSGQSSRMSHSQAPILYTPEILFESGLLPPVSPLCLGFRLIVPFQDSCSVLLSGLLSVFPLPLHLLPSNWNYSPKKTLCHTTSLLENLLWFPRFHHQIKMPSLGICIPQMLFSRLSEPLSTNCNIWYPQRCGFLCLKISSDPCLLGNHLLAL